MLKRTLSILVRGFPLLVLVLGFTSRAHAIPAFARKYGLRCTACHEAWPALNDFGRSFRDNGYQMMLGHDAPTAHAPAFWPVALRITPHYEYNSVNNQTTDQGKKTLGSGGVSNIGADLLIGGVLVPDITFLVVPTGFTSNEGVTLESAWVRFDNIAGTPWLNVKLGKHELDLPRSGHRSWSLTDPGYVIYGYHAPGSALVFDMGENQRGIEYVGHDRGSLNRVSVSVFNVEGSPGSRNAFDTPGYYAHATHQWLFDHSSVSAARIGAFGSYTTWPTEFLTLNGEPIDGTGGNLANAQKYGVEGHVWFGPSATPFHTILVYAQGKDGRDLIPGATRDGSFGGGFLELGWTPTLKSTYFGRWDLVKNRQQAVPGTPTNFSDVDAFRIGTRQTLSFTDRAEVAVHVEYSTTKTKKVADDGSDLTTKSVFLGVDFAF